MKELKTIILILTGLLVACGGGGGDKNATPGNTAPIVNEVTLSPLNPSVNSEITAQITGFDKEGDPLTYEVKWYVNRRSVGEGMLLKYEDIKKGDAIYAEVTAFDGKNRGLPVKSEEVTIGSSEPRLIAVKVVPEPIYATSPEIRLDATVEDADQDSVDLFCYYYVNDRVLPETMNVLSLPPLNLKKHDTINASAFATDGSARSQPFPFYIIVSNSPPELQVENETVKMPMDNLNYQVPITDPNGDRMTFALTGAPEGVIIEPTTGVITGNAGDARSIEVTVRATDVEGAYLDAKFTIIGQ